jgi:hypothetical protein
MYRFGGAINNAKCGQKMAFLPAVEQEASQPITADVAQCLFSLVPVFFQDLFYFKGFVAGPAVGFDTASCCGQLKAFGIAGRTNKRVSDV